jgi:MFS family permease
METQVRGAFRSREFCRYFLGYAASLLGTAMAGTASTFAFLDTGRGAGDLGLIMACGIVPVLLALPVSGVVADRLGSRRVLLFADALRCGNRAGFAATLVAVQRPPVWVFVFFAVVEGAGDGFFFPAYSALIPRLVGPELLTPANALLGIARSTSSVLGPSLSGVLVAAFGSAPVLCVDSASFAVCFIALLGIPIEVPAAPAKSFRADFRQGWSVFSAHPWLWLQTLQFALFNFLVWAPFLVLGPTLAETRYGGARAWGVTMGAYGLGAVLGGWGLLRRRGEPRRPLFVALVATTSYALAPGAFSLGLPIPAIVAAMTLCGAGTAVSGALYSSVQQRVLPGDALARVSSYNYLGAFAIGPIGLALAGPVGGAVGYRGLLAFGALYHLGSCALMLALPWARTVPAACPDEDERDSCQGPDPGVTVRA